MPERSLAELEQELRALREALNLVERRQAKALHRRFLRLLGQPRMRLLLASAVVVIPVAAYAVTIPNTFVNGTVADASDVNENFNALASALNAHEPDASAHHAKTTSATELTSGTVSDARLSANVSLLGPSIALGEIAFDTATQIELDLHAAASSAHHTRYADSEAIAAVGPHINLPNRILVAPSGGDFSTIQAAIDSVTPTASNPYLIEIAPGTYNEVLTLKSHLHLRGASTSGTVITPSSAGSTHVTAKTRTGVKLSQLTLLDTGLDRNRAIAATSTQLTLHDVRIEGYAEEWILASGSATLHVTRSEFLDPNFDHARGINLQDSEALITASVLETVDCAIEALRSDLTLTDSEVRSLEVCALGTATPQRHVAIAHNRLDSVRVSGNARVKINSNEISNSNGGHVSLDVAGGSVELTGNWIRGTETQVVLVQDGDVSIIGNRIEGSGGQTSGVIALAGSAVRLIGNSISATDDAVRDDGTALILGNRIDAGGIIQSVNTISLGNSVLSQPTVEGWVNRREIQLESTDNGVVLRAGGSAITLAASGDVSIQAAGDLDLTGTNVTISASGELELNGSTQIDANGGVINLN